MQTITNHEFEALVENAKILEQDKRGGKVFLTTDNRIVKCFRAKRHSISSNRIWPYATRFMNNAIKLKQRGITSVAVTHNYFIPEKSRYAVVYPLLPGKTIREALQGDESLSGTISYIAHLHDKGIYFRSLHFGNILLQPDNQYALIDIADMQFHWFNLSLFSRLRNFRHLLLYPQDKAAILAYGKNETLKTYLEATQLSKLSQFIFSQIYYRFF
ncbi:MAG: toluene tolerance protein [Methylococcales bacterium]|jgi:hypothetical protein|nr:toluene tolerance protein [Methylococcales bacterium]MBT7443387.1 toluene tolerance protein [Methylococcales bacterium]